MMMEGLDLLGHGAGSDYLDELEGELEDYNAVDIIQVHASMVLQLKDLRW